MIELGLGLEEDGALLGEVLLAERAGLAAARGATGTTDGVPGPQQNPQQSPHLSMQNGATACEPEHANAAPSEFHKCVAIAGINDEVQAVATACNNEADGIRTRNPRIDSPIL